MTPSQFETYKEIRRLLTEAYDDYFKRGDGYCKSSEGYIEVRYPTYFKVRDGHPSDEATSIGIYSYVLGPSRMHDFDSFDKALKAVQRWHKQQLDSESER